MDVRLDQIEIKGEIVGGISEIVAMHDGDVIGFIQFVVKVNIDDEEPAIAYPYIMYVKEEYRRNGVATKIIQEVQKEVVVMFEADLGHSGNDEGIHYSEEGLAFKDYCEMKGITKPEEI